MRNIDPALLEQGCRFGGVDSVGHLTVPVPLNFTGEVHAASPGPEWVEVGLGRLWVRRVGERFELRRVVLGHFAREPLEERVAVGAAELPGAVVRATDEPVSPCAWRDLDWIVQAGDRALTAYAVDVAVMRNALNLDLRAQLPVRGGVGQMWLAAAPGSPTGVALHLRVARRQAAVAGAVVRWMEQRCWDPAELQPCSGCELPHRRGGLAAALSGIGLAGKPLELLVTMVACAEEPPF